MRVGIDYWPATTHAPGVGRYVRELVRALVTLPDAPELALFDVGRGERTLPEAALGLPATGVTRVTRSLPRRLFGPFAADRWLGGVDLFQRAFAAHPRVAAAPEVLPVAELPAPKDERRFTAALRRAARVVVFSHALSAELLERYGLPTERLRYLPVGCDHWRRDLGLRVVEPVEPARFVVLGARRPERYPLSIARAFAELVRSGVDAELVFAGRPGPEDSALRGLAGAEPLRGRVTLREPVETELPALVAGSAVLVHLNVAETTPVTPLEAFSLGVAVVASRLPAFEEALADEPVWVDPETTAEPAALAQAFAAALELAGAPERRAARIAIADEHTWHAHARATLALWHEVAGSA